MRGPTSVAPSYFTCFVSNLVLLISVHHSHSHISPTIPRLLPPIASDLVHWSSVRPATIISPTMPTSAAIIHQYHMARRRTAPSHPQFHKLSDPRPYVIRRHHAGRTDAPTPPTLHPPPYHSSVAPSTTAPVSCSSLAQSQPASVSFSAIGPLRADRDFISPYHPESVIDIDPFGRRPKT